MQSINTNKDNEEIKQINMKLEKLELSINDYKAKLEQLEKKYEEELDKIKNLEKLFNKSGAKEIEEKVNDDNIENLIKINSNETYKFVNNPSNLTYNKCITVNKNENCILEYIVYHSFLDGNQYLISTNKDNYNLDVYDLSNGTKVNSLQGHENRIEYIRYFSNNNKSYFVSSDKNNTLIVWDDNYKILNRIETGYKGSRIDSYLLFHKNEKYYYIIIPSKEINEYTKIYDNKGSFIKTVFNTDKNVTNHLDIWSYNNNHYLIETTDKKVNVINLFKDELYHEFTPNGGTYLHYGIIYKQNYYIINIIEPIFSINFITIYDLIHKNNYKSIKELDYYVRDYLLWNDQYLLSCNRNRSHSCIQIYNIETLKEEQKIIDGNIKIFEARAIKLNNIGESLVISDEQSNYKIYSIKK